MGWGTCFTADIYMSRESIKDLYTLESEIESADNDIRTIRERILMYCAAGVSAGQKKDVEGNDLDPIFSIHTEVSELFEWYQEAVEKKYKLQLLKDDWDDKENKFKTAYVG